MFQDDNNSSSKLSWLNGSPGSFQNWRKPKQPFLGLKKEFHFGHDISVFQESESALYPYVSTRMYTAFMIYSTIDMKWVTVPCQLEFTNVLLICQHHNNTHHDGRSNTTSTQMYRQYRECLHDWVVIEDACHQMIDIRGNLNLTCNDFTGICQQYGAHLYMHETRNNAQVGNISKNLFYFSSWSYGREKNHICNLEYSRSEKMWCLADSAKTDPNLDRGYQTQQWLGLVPEASIGGG